MAELEKTLNEAPKTLCLKNLLKASSLKLLDKADTMSSHKRVSCFRGITCQLRENFMIPTKP